MSAAEWFKRLIKKSLRRSEIFPLTGAPDTAKTKAGCSQKR